MQLSVLYRVLWMRRQVEPTCDRHSTCQEALQSVSRPVSAVSLVGQWSQPGGWTVKMPMPELMPFLSWLSLLLLQAVAIPQSKDSQSHGSQLSITFLHPLVEVYINE